MWAYKTKENFEVGFIKNYFHNLLSWEDIETFINIRPLITSKRFFAFNDSNVGWDNDTWATDKNTIPPTIAKDLIENSGVCLITDTSRFCKKLNDFSHTLEQKYGRPVDSHIYMCRNIERSHPFGIHYDYNHNVIVQCEGQTNFKVWNIVKDKSFDNSKMEISDKPILDVIMYPGDAIWIPAYYPHLAISQSQRLSVSFPVAVNDQLEEMFFIQEREWVKL